MQIVIELQDDDASFLMKSSFIPVGYFDSVHKALRNGIILPSGHGRFVDVKEILDAYENSYKGTHADDLSAFLSEYVQTVIPEEKEKNERETKSKEIKER